MCRRHESTAREMLVGYCIAEGAGDAYCVDADVCVADCELGVLVDAEW
jgi:hypothetical protein